MKQARAASRELEFIEYATEGKPLYLYVLEQWNGDDNTEWFDFIGVFVDRKSAKAKAKEIYKDWVGYRDVTNNFKITKTKLQGEL